MKNFQPEIEWWSIDRVIPYPLNTKLHPPNQIAAIAGAIAEFGWDVPIVVDESGVIVKGHGRRLAAQQLGLTSVPVVVRADLSEAQLKAARISDNKSSESGWDLDFLKIEFEALSELDYDLNLTGFGELEIADLFLDGESDAEDTVRAEAEDQSDQIKDQFQVIVTCKSEAEQSQVLEKLSEDGHECRALLS